MKLNTGLISDSKDQTIQKRFALIGEVVYIKHGPNGI